MPPLPSAVASLASELAALPGVVAVALGGSRATGAQREDSDWDLGVYYRGSFDAGRVRELGHSGYVSEPGDWGPVINGGAWLTVDGLAVDLIFRDLDVVERWLADAEQGRFEVLAQNGYVVGAPTYVLVGELAINQPLSGELPRPDYPAALSTAATERWRGHAAVALMFARIHARADDSVPCAGMLAEATLCEAHARLAERGEWVLNEKRLVERAGLQPLQAPVSAQAVDAVAAALGVAPLEGR